METDHTGFWPRFKEKANRDFPLWLAGVSFVAAVVAAYSFWTYD